MPYPNITTTQREYCGPDPIGGFVEKLASTGYVTDQMKAPVLQCSYAAANTNVSSWTVFSENWTNCLSRTPMDPASGLARVINTPEVFRLSTYLYNSATRKMDEWNRCAAQQADETPQYGQRPNVPVFDHSARFVLGKDIIVGEPFEFRRIYPNGREVHYIWTILHHNIGRYDHVTLVKVEWPGVTDYWDIVPLSDSTLELSDCTLRFISLPGIGTVLEIAPKN